MVSFVVKLTGDVDINTIMRSVTYFTIPHKKETYCEVECRILTKYKVVLISKCSIDMKSNIFQFTTPIANTCRAAIATEVYTSGENQIA